MLAADLGALMLMLQHLLWVFLATMAHICMLFVVQHMCLKRQEGQVDAAVRTICAAAGQLCAPLVTCHSVYSHVIGLESWLIIEYRYSDTSEWVQTIPICIGWEVDFRVCGHNTISKERANSQVVISREPFPWCFQHVTLTCFCSCLLSRQLLGPAVLGSERKGTTCQYNLCCCQQ